MASLDVSTPGAHDRDAPLAPRVQNAGERLHKLRWGSLSNGLDASW